MGYTPVPIDGDDGFAYMSVTTDAKTMSGTPVPMLKALKEMTSSEKAAAVNSDVSTFGVKKLGDATAYYNCHSYTWYSKASTNPYWLVDINCYVDDAHCS